MGEEFQKVKVAVVQSSPVLFDREATIEKTCRLIREVGDQDVNLVLFPEAFIPPTRVDSALGRLSAAEAPREGAPLSATGQMPFRYPALLLRL